MTFSDFSQKLFKSFKDLDFLKFQRIAIISKACAGALAPALFYVLAISLVYFLNNLLIVNEM